MTVENAPSATCSPVGAGGRRKVPRHAIRLLWPSLLAAAQPALGLEPLDGIQVHGFLSQAYFLTSGNKVFGDSNHGGSLGYTNMALNVSWTPLPNLQFAAQGLFRRAGEGHEHDLRLDYGLVDYSFISTEEWRIGTRLGRYKLPLGLYNDTRDVPFTRPTILLPQSIYFDRTRDLALSGDGGLLYGERRGDWGTVSAEFGVGRPLVDSRDSELGLIGRNRALNQDWPGHFTAEPSFIGRLMYQMDEGRLRLAVTRIDLQADYEPTFLAPNNVVGGRLRDLPPGRFRFEPWYFSAQYNGEDWSLTGEYGLRASTMHGAGLAKEKAVDGESYYIQGTYRFLPQLQGLVRYDVYYADRDDRDGSSSVVGPSYTQFAKDWTVGLRYDVTPYIMLQTEYHRVYGTGWLPIQDNMDPDAQRKQWDIFALQLSFRF